MALIKCPECGKEFSDKAAACPNCAFPMTEILKMNSGDKQESGEDETSINTNVTNENDATSINSGNSLTYNDDNTSSTGYLTRTEEDKMYSIDTKTTKKSKKGIIIGVIIALVMIAGVSVFLILKGSSDRKKEAYERAIKAFSRGDYEKAMDDFEQLGIYKDSKKYLSICEAQQLCSAGKYEDAFDEMKGITDFEEAKGLLRQIYYEGRFFEGVTDMRAYYKNPDSLQINNADVYSQNGKIVYIVTSSGQNGFGGYSSSNSLLVENKNGEFEYLGSCHSMDESDYNTKDEDDIYELIILRSIKLIREEGIKIDGAMNFERVKSIIQNGNYTSIKRVRDLTMDMISE